MLVALLAGAVHLPILHAPFYADDEAIIQDALRATNAGRLVSCLSPGYWQADRGGAKGLYRPLREIVLAGIATSVGWRPAAFHGLNLVLHMANAVLVLALVRTFADSRAAFLSALIFALHPVHVEAMGFAKNLAELLVSALGLGCVLTFAAAAAKEKLTGRAWPLYVASLACMLLGLLTKEMAATLPLLVLLAAHARSNRAGVSPRHVKLSLPFWALLIAYGAFQVLFLLPGLGAAAGAAPSRARLAPATLAFYARSVFVPFPLSVGHTLDLSRMHVAIGAAALVVLGAGAAAISRRWQRGRLFLWWGFIAILPVSNIIGNVGRLVGEQRLYWPSVGVCALLGCGLARLRRGRLAAGLTGLLVAVLAGASFARSALWSRPGDFARDWVRRQPSNGAAHLGLGKLYSDRRPRSQARVHLARAVVAPGTTHEQRAQALAELGVWWGRAGRVHLALPLLRRAVLTAPAYAGAHEALATTFLMLGRAAEALPHLRAAAALAPERPGPCVMLGQAMVELGRYGEARRQLGHALARFPEDGDAHAAMGVLGLRTDDTSLAVRHLEMATRLAPRRDEFWRHLATAYERAGRSADAAAAMRRASRMPPRSPL